ncbi:MAG: class I SAM-dependent methyltransferase [Candidatus Pacearchaeota archaeon]
MDQKEVWNQVAEPWKIFRVNPDKEVINFLKNKKGKILDLACGSGRNFVKSDEIKLYAVDFSSKMLEYAKDYVKKNNLEAEIFESSAEKLPFENNFFDYAIFIRALHCIDYEEKRKRALEELYRVLKPNAEILISVWNKDQERFKNSGKEEFIPWKHEGEEFMRYYYLYEEDEFLNLLREVGFEILKVGSEEIEGFNSKKNIVAVVRKPN